MCEDDTIIIDRFSFITRGDTVSSKFCFGGGMVYTGDLKSPARTGMRVRVSPEALMYCECSSVGKHLIDRRTLDNILAGIVQK